MFAIKFRLLFSCFLGHYLPKILGYCFHVHWDYVCLQFQEDYDNQTVTLKNPIDLNDLRNNQEKGIEFELEEEEAPPGL